METATNSHPTDVSPVIRRNAHPAAERRNGSLSVLLARFASDLSCQLGLLLCQRGHRVVAQSSMAQFASLGLGGCEDECFPCTEIHFPYLGRDRIESVLDERGPFDVVVFDMLPSDPEERPVSRCGQLARACPAIGHPDAALLSDVESCARRLGSRGGAIWLLGQAEDGVGVCASINGCKTFLHALAGDPELARVSLNGTRIAPLQGRIEAIHFERHETMVFPSPMLRSARNSMDLATALLDLLAVDPPGMCRAGRFAAALS